LRESILALDQTIHSDEEDTMSGIPQPNKSPSGRPVADPDATDDYDTVQVDDEADEGKTKMQINYIDEALEESIPASDPPSSTPTTGVGPPSHPGDKTGT
jgi:hypothetical protein